MSVSSPRKSTDSQESPQTPSITRNAYPFPHDSPSNRYRPRRGSAASSISVGSVANSALTSVGGALDIAVPRIHAPVKETGQNAISTLLQPPIIRTGLLAPASAVSTTYRAPTSKDIAPVTLTNIPHVDPSAFNDYLARIGPLFDSFQRARAENNESDTPTSPAISRQSSATSLLSPIDGPRIRRRSSAYSRRKANEPTPLSTIPNVYFEENFHLENPRTFDVVSEHAEIVKPQPGAPSQDQNGASRPPRKSLATNAILQEKLSWYMDTVEVHLITSISNASTSFFAALGSLRDLEHEAAESVARIQKLRADLARLDQDMAMGGLEVANLRTRHENVRKLAKAVEQVARVVEEAKQCEDLVDRGEFDTASHAMLKLEKLIAGEAEPGAKQLIDLRSLKAFQGLSDALDNLRLRISKGFETRFLEALMLDLRQHVERVPHTSTLQRWANTFQRARGEARIPTAAPAYMETNHELRKDLLASLHGLSASGQTARATTAFRDGVMKEMKALIRKHLPSSSDDDVESVTSVSTRGGKQLSQQDKSAILARNLRALDEEAAEEMFVHMYTGISEVLRRLSVQIKVLLDVTSTVDAPTRASSRGAQGLEGQRGRAQSLQEEVTQALDLSSLLGQAVEIAQTQIARVLKVRTEQSVRMALDRFIRYFTLNRLFADECEAVSGHSGTALKNIVAGHLTAFIQNRSETTNQRIAQTLDSDQWEAKDFTEEHQEVLARLLQGMTSDPVLWLRGTRVWEDARSSHNNGGGGTNGLVDEGKMKANGGTAAHNKSQPRPAYIDDTRYILVASVLSLLGPIEESLSLIASVPSIGALTVSSMADFLRTFNSRTSQLVLGAGATRIAGLKNITTKHLALASQALSFVIALTPYVREAVRRHIGTGAGKAETLGEFDKVKRVYQDHQMGIHDKLVEIMTTRATAHVTAMKKIDFDAKSPSDAASPYMETLTKETATLYRVLSRHLSEPDVNSIVAQIFNGYKSTWTKAFSDTVVKTPGGKERLLRDAELFETRLGKISGFDDVGRDVVKSVEEKSVAESVAASEQKSAPVEAAEPAGAAIADEKKEDPAEDETGSEEKEGKTEAIVKKEGEAAVEEADVARKTE